MADGSGPEGASPHRIDETKEPKVGLPATLAYTDFPKPMTSPRGWLLPVIYVFLKGGGGASMIAASIKLHFPMFLPLNTTSAVPVSYYLIVATYLPKPIPFSRD
ncbi:uncharacterized protein F4812DRAFT_201319 [Daldinia caldariorum]|uniref:uncharacterized protein n=1 Tax=Daldinia caldariorum TaxID=326644 RepID=UPI002007AA45|nr:uncharacterized protein F4812DRAFT_201319 [Daldinia caldariorum]KAI1471982.1 hypothetical protein F4812DRAFT_201319 [Daldinia caldariorum]